MPRWAAVLYVNALLHLKVICDFLAGFIKTFGNHVVDWEGPTIRFQHGIPTDIDVPVHR
jgi:hypothetical protein